MSKFLSYRFDKLEPYTPGEQPQDKKYIKLNTNESPFPPSPFVVQAISKDEVEKLNLYPDPTENALISAIAKYYGVEKENVFASNSSDDVLSFCFSAFCDDRTGACFADITYPFYPVFCNYYNLNSNIIPLREDYTINVNDYINTDETIFIANPNANTGLCLTPFEIERLVANNPERIVVIDEAYVDFGGESCIPLTKRYKNLIVVQTFSKSRSLAGSRLGFAIADKELINDLNTLRFSFNPYTINRLSLIAGIKAIEDKTYFYNCRNKVIENREWSKVELLKLGFKVLDSKANFIFVSNSKITGKDLYLKLKERGILVRYFDKDKMRDFVRITIGTKEQMQTLIATIITILKGV